MTTNHRARRWAATGAGLALAVSLAACGGNVGGGGSDAEGEEFPGGDPITMFVGQDPGGSTDLIARAAAEILSDELGVAVTVENKPGANGALAAQELAGEEPDGHTLMVYNGSLAYITPLASEDAPDIADFDIVTGLSLDDYVLVTAPDSGFSTVEDLAAAGRPITFGTTGVGTGSQLSQELLFAQADIDATAVPFDGGSPTLTAVLGGQVDVGSIQLGEAIEQIGAGELTPIVTFAEERPSYLPDTPTAVEAGYDVPVQQSRAVFAPKGVPDDVMQTLRDAFQTAFEDEGYQQFNEDNLLTPNELDGEEIRENWTENLEKYRAVVEEYSIDLGGE
ncbi:tripartite tricarboxylate transporter substrate binding protein [Blastococcus saxobsidens]|uniref:Tripartite-type tricarboxylate transporter receptor subunit TctC n=1 Tax=Blastococcus saxobsidens TaxID=138336 RepID=A0A4Q7Y493_9ACTN|nr:tripartite tricarboxylate transporter substrate binding protein [Blastococcus saxobsidens]RZU31640.1 tripartite-type tricarboxylate transporter receptor subunit TctC [Blastococcus saxobsidens]